MNYNHTYDSNLYGGDNHNVLLAESKNQPNLPINSNSSLVSNSNGNNANLPINPSLVSNGNGNLSINPSLISNDNLPINPNLVSNNNANTNDNLNINPSLVSNSNANLNINPSLVSNSNSNANLNINPSLASNNVNANLNINPSLASNNVNANLNINPSLVSNSNVNTNPTSSLESNLNQHETENKNVIAGVNDPNTIIGINDPNIVAGLPKLEGNYNEGNFTYFNLISHLKIEKSDSELINNSNKILVSQIRNYIQNINPILDNLKVEIINSEPYTHVSQLTNNIKENREGSQITSHMTKESEQHNEKYNYVIKSCKNKKKKAKNNSKKNKYQTGGENKNSDIFAGIEKDENDNENKNNNENTNVNANKNTNENVNEDTNENKNNNENVNVNENKNNNENVNVNENKNNNENVNVNENTNVNANKNTNENVNENTNENKNSNNNGNSNENIIKNHENLLMGIDVNNNEIKNDTNLDNFHYIITIKITYEEGPIEEINKLNLHGQKITFNIEEKNIEFIIYSIGRLWNLLNQWDGRNAVNRFVGDKQDENRVDRFGKSVNYLKKITHRLRDCSEISVAYQIKHQEVQTMIVSIRKLYSLILFLRDQIERNQKNYDTLERLILEIVIAMNQDYHIPYDQLLILKQVQDKIAKDGKDLEERFRVVSNQILDRLSRAGSLKETSPNDIGNNFPLDISGLSKQGNPLPSDEANKFQKYVIPADPVKPSGPSPNWETTKYFKSEMSNRDKIPQGIGEPYQPYINPYQHQPDKTVVTDSGNDRLEFGEYNPNVNFVSDKNLGETEFVKSELAKREQESDNLIGHLKKQTVNNYKNDTRKIQYLGKEMSQEMYDKRMIKEANEDAIRRLGRDPLKNTSINLPLNNGINNLSQLNNFNNSNENPNSENVIVGVVFQEAQNGEILISKNNGSNYEDKIGNGVFYKKNDNGQVIRVDSLGNPIQNYNNSDVLSDKNNRTINLPLNENVNPNQLQNQNANVSNLPLNENVNPNQPQNQNANISNLPLNENVNPNQNVNPPNLPLNESNVNPNQPQNQNVSSTNNSPSNENNKNASESNNNPQTGGSRNKKKKKSLKKQKKNRRIYKF